MVDQQLSLSLAFIRSHPDAAARALERHDLESVARFVSGLPHAYSEQLIPRMLPRYLGRLCEILDEKTITGLLEKQDASFTAAVLRHLDSKKREKVLGKLAPGRRAASNLLLSFSSDTVGAWLTPMVATVPDDCSVEEALHHVKVAGEETYSDYVFVVDRDRFLRGRIRNLDLLRAEPDRPVTAIMEERLQAITARLSLERAAEHKAWAMVDVMPVNNRRSQFVGVIRHVDLRKGLEQLHQGVGNEILPEGDPLDEFLKLFGTSLLALFNTLGEALDTSAQNRGDH